ncbi:MAG: ABC transporter ATP-binding protein [Lachnospiraceae bacterium]|nr:ABC transporter ATP-binding protein [Lachnospiraceae bacterium]
MKAVIAENLTKIYPSGKKAVIDTSFTLEQGEVFGFLGPNGAGKTTVVKLLNGILTPTEGICRVFDTDPAANPVEVRQFSGVVTEHAQMYGDMSGLQNLIFYGTAFGLSAAESKTRGIDLLEKLELTHAENRKLDTYSTGMRQRLSLARAMIHRPKILFLDEPTSGLDPESVQSVNNMIKNLAEKEGTTIFLCTHQLRYAQEICSSYGLIANGDLLAAGDLAKLRALIFSGLIVSIKSDRCPKDIAFTKTGEMDYEIKVDSEAEIPAIIKRIVNEEGNIYNVAARRLSLEEIYFGLLDKRNAEECSGKGAKND